MSPTVLPSTDIPSNNPTYYPSLSLSPSAVFVITTIAGSGASSFSGDNGAATSAGLYNPAGVTVDSLGTKPHPFIINKFSIYSIVGNMYIADESNNRIRKVTISTGIITTIAGNGGTGSYSGDNGQATAAALNYPNGIALDSTGYDLNLILFLCFLIYNVILLGNVYISDTHNHRIRKVTVSTGIITTIAGTGTTGYSGDNGQATSAVLNFPLVIALDSAGNCFLSHFVYIITLSLSNLLGNLYIADQGNNRIRKVTVSTGIITTIAGTGTPIYSGDNGQATSAGLCYPQGIALDSAGMTTTLTSCNYQTYSNYMLLRQRVHRRYLQPSYPQGDGLNRNYYFDCWYGIDYLLW